MRGDGPPEVVTRAPVGNDPRFSPVQPAPMGFTADGPRLKMARLLTMVASSSDVPEECFAIFDDDIHAHAEWRTVKEAAPEVSEGDRLEMEWQEAYSVGTGTVIVREYDRPRPGTYRIRVQPVDLLGLPNAAESSLSICFLAPWWQRGWVWVLAAAVIVTCAFGVSRYESFISACGNSSSTSRKSNSSSGERLRIARDLHDTLAQGFTGVIVQLEAAEDFPQSRGLGQETTAHLKRAGDLARGSLQEARRSVRSRSANKSASRKRLPGRPGCSPRKDDRGRRHAEQKNWIVDGESRRLAFEVEENLLHIGQEALVNALRHAHASEFTARLVFWEPNDSPGTAR